jgi:hypothetical protein
MKKNIVAYSSVRRDRTEQRTDLIDELPQKTK